MERVFFFSPRQNKKGEEERKFKREMNCAHVRRGVGLEVKDTLHIVADWVVASPSLSLLLLLSALSFTCVSAGQETPSSSYLLILLFCPGSFHQLGVEHLLPAVLTLAICPPLRTRPHKAQTPRYSPPCCTYCPTAGNASLLHPAEANGWRAECRARHLL